MGKKKIEINAGDEFVVNHNYKVRVVEYRNYNHIEVVFEKGNTKIVTKNSLLIGNVKNVYHPFVYNKGFFGEGLFNSKTKNFSKIYSVWYDMMQRGYSEKQPSYKDVTVCEEWYNFQNFAKWFEENYNPETMKGWHLDKDITCPKCKEYNPENCAFVPQEINKLFAINKSRKGLYPTGVSFSKQNKKYAAKIKKFNKNYFIGYYESPQKAYNAYKREKEKHIKDVAEKWKDKISNKIYNTLKNYTI